MKRPLAHKPLPCLLGLHSYRPVRPPSQFFVEVQCERCGRYSVLPLNTGHERGGPSR